MTASILCEGISKEYPVRSRNSDGRWETRPVRALDGVSFATEPGEVLGIVGRNGAGKSTLLKILSRVVAPTEGRALLRGRIASLLEVGTGMHPELTGRENILLNGRILGMSREYVLSRMDEIVDFAGVDRYLDTPIKRYSSGMALRLAFAVAAFQRTDILVVDEVLAVGDAEFQRKCLGVLGEGLDGRTVLFVSHDLAAVARLCPRSLWLDRGRVLRDGPTAEVLSGYLGSAGAGAGMRYEAAPSGSGKGARIGYAGIPGGPAAVVQGGPLVLDVVIEDPAGDPDLHLLLSLRSEDLITVCSFSTLDHGFRMEPGPGSRKVRLIVDELRLLPGFHTVAAWLFRSALSRSETVEEVSAMLRFEVQAADVLGTGIRPPRAPNRGVSWMRARFEAGTPAGSAEVRP